MSEVRFYYKSKEGKVLYSLKSKSDREDLIEITKEEFDSITSEAEKKVAELKRQKGIEW